MASYLFLHHCTIDLFFLQFHCLIMHIVLS